MRHADRLHSAPNTGITAVIPEFIVEPTGNTNPFGGPSAIKKGLTIFLSINKMALLVLFSIFALCLYIFGVVACVGVKDEP